MGQAGFQTVINQQPAPGIAGTFASASPRYSTIAGPGGLVADPVNGVTVGNFGWLDATGSIVTSYGAAGVVPNGFVHRYDNMASILIFNTETSQTIRPGSNMTMLSRCTVWVNTTTVATMGQKIFARSVDGAIGTGATGATITGYVETRFYCWTAGNVGDVIKMSEISPT